MTTTSGPWGRGKIISLVLVVGLIGLGLYVVLGGKDDAPKADAVPTAAPSATADAGSVFAGWSGAGCVGTGSRALKLADNASVEAPFERLTAIRNTPVIRIQPRRVEAKTERLLRTERPTAESGPTMVTFADDIVGTGDMPSLGRLKTS